MSETRPSLDAAIRAHAHAENDIDDGEVILSWMVLIGTRNVNDGGATIIYVSEGGMPPWQAKGLLTEALDVARQPGEDEA